MSTSTTLKPEDIINPEQQLKQVIIETPLREERLNGVTYVKVQQTILEDLQKLYDSDFYQSINVHYGAKSKFQRENVQEQIYQRRKQIIKLKINEENDYIKKLRLATNEEDIDRIQKQYQKNLDLIEERKNHFSEDQFVPWIYVEAQKKRPVYGKIFQQFDRKGAAMLKATLGYRAPFSTFDKIQFNMQTLPIEYLRKRKYYMFGINWMKPITYKNQEYDIFATGQNSCSPIFKSIDEKKSMANFGIIKGEDRIQLQFAKRYPRFFQKIQDYCLKDMFHASRKVSAKFDRTFNDTIERGDIMTGKYSNGKIQATIPFLSQSNFLKLEYNSRKFYDLYNFGQNFNNQKLKNLFTNSNIESNISLKAVASLTNFISDFQEKFEIRGFENQRNPDDSICQIKTSFKFNNYNYPLFGGVGIVPFLYAQAGVSVQKQWKKSHALGSVGLGVSYPLSKFIQIQLLYALLQAQNYSARETVNFQIRIGLLD